MCALLFVLMSVFTVHAQEVHFFGSIDYARTTTKNSIQYNNIRNSYSASNLDSAGVNVSSKFSENSQGLVQLIHLPVPNKFAVDLIQYQRTFSEEVKVRIGKQRLPLFLKSEVIQVKALYPWASPPNQLYGQVPLHSFVGGSLEKNWGPFSVQLYGGSIDEEIYLNSSQVNLKGSDLMGTRLNYNNDSFDAYLHYNKYKVDVTFLADAPLGSGVYGTAKSTVPVKNNEILSGGMSYEKWGWLFMTEYFHLMTTSSVVKTAEAAYGSVGYHFTEKFLALATYSTDMQRKATFTPSPTTSYDLTFQYSLDENTVFKLGLTHVNYHYKAKPTSATPTGIGDSSSGFSGAPGNNFNVYDLQLAFVF